MMLHIPGQTDHGIETTTPTEFLDLMPTLAEVAAKTTIPPCPEGNTSHIKLCTHGVSLLPLITDPSTPVKKAAFSQYPRSYQVPKNTTDDVVETGTALGAGESSGASPCLTKACTMGYSLLTHQEGTEYRYTEWVDFNTKTFGKPDWERVVGVELYDHKTDPMENFNVAKDASDELKLLFSTLLRGHPVYGAGR